MRVAVSGCFDPIHAGHISLLKEASKFGSVIVILKGDERTKRKKIPLMLAHERAEIMRAIKYVDEVIIYDNKDKHHDDFSEALEIIKPDIYCAGSDRKNAGDIPYIYKVCKRLKIEIKYNVGGDKISSSSEILKTYVTHLSNTTK